MKPKSILTLMWFSIILLLLGALVMSPVVVFLLAIPTILCALIVIFFGSLIPCIVGAIVLAASIFLATSQYPEASQQLENYKQRAMKPSASRASAPSVPASKK